MARETSIALSDHATAFIERQMSHGRYDSVSDVVGAGLRLLEEREVRLEVLRSALIEGENSGAFEAFDPEQFLADMRPSTEG